MKKNFFLAIGAVVLTAAGAFAGKYSAKGQSTKLFISNGATCIAITGTFTGSANVTSGGGNQQASLNTTNGGQHKIYSTLGCHAAAAVHVHLL